MFNVNFLSERPEEGTLVASITNTPSIKSTKMYGYCATTTNTGVVLYKDASSARYFVEQAGVYEIFEQLGDNVPTEKKLVGFLISATLSPAQAEAEAKAILKQFGF
jgi:hypothetical protein